MTQKKGQANNGKTKERRAYFRFPVLKDLAKPVDLFFNSSSVPVPAVLLDLSTNGMGLLTFVPVEIGVRINANITLPGLKISNIEGKVIWTLTKGDSWRIGINFTKIDKNASDKIKNMITDYTECENRIFSGIKDACVNNCSYFLLCSKSVKKEKANAKN